MNTEEIYKALKGLAGIDENGERVELDQLDSNPVDDLQIWSLYYSNHKTFIYIEYKSETHGIIRDEYILCK